MCPGPRNPTLYCRVGRGGMEKWQFYGQDTFVICACQSHTPPTTIHPAAEPCRQQSVPKNTCFPSCFYSFGLHGTSFSSTSILAANPHPSALSDQSVLAPEYCKSLQRIAHKSPITSPLFENLPTCQLRTLENSRTMPYASVVWVTISSARTVGMFRADASLTKRPIRQLLKAPHDESGHV